VMMQKRDYRSRRGIEWEPSHCRPGPCGLHLARSASRFRLAECPAPARSLRHPARRGNVLWRFSLAFSGSFGPLPAFAVSSICKL